MLGYRKLGIASHWFDFVFLFVETILII